MAADGAGNLFVANHHSLGEYNTTGTVVNADLIEIIRFREQTMRKQNLRTFNLDHLGKLLA
jgi:hypothetical protein